VDRKTERVEWKGRQREVRTKQDNGFWFITRVASSRCSVSFTRKSIVAEGLSESSIVSVHRVCGFESSLSVSSPYARTKYDWEGHSLLMV
jgi:hypothetical protein